MLPARRVVVRRVVAAADERDPRFLVAREAARQAKAAQNAAIRHAALAESSDPSGRHARRTRRLVLEKVDVGDYVGAYRLVHHLGCLQSTIGTDEQVPTATTTADRDADSLRMMQDVMSLYHEQIMARPEQYFWYNKGTF